MPVLSSYVCDHAITTMQEFKNSSPVDYLTLSPHVMLITAMNSTQKSGNSITAYHYHWVVVMELALRGTKEVFIVMPATPGCILDA